MKPILKVESLKMHFPISRGQSLFSRERSILKAVDDVSFSIARGETLGLVGESGCGKTTIGRCLLRLLQPTAGKIELGGHDITQMKDSQLRPLRQQIQMVFQDPADSLSPRLKVQELIEEPLIIHQLGNKLTRAARVKELLDQVGLPSNSASKYPHEFSGGQKQRISIARALAPAPRLLVLDEAVSALDVSVQSQVLNLLLELQRELGLSYLFISHDLSVVKHISDRIAVMYSGKIVEMAAAEKIYAHPKHAYTRALFSAIPKPDPTNRKRGTTLPGDVTSPIDPQPGSPFGRRVNHPYLEVTYGMDLRPREIEPGHWVAPDPCAISLNDLMKLGIDIYQ